MMKNEKNTRILRGIVYSLLFITLPAFITVCVEFIQIKNVGETIEWISGHTYQLLLGYIFVLLTFVILYIAFSRLWVAMLGTSLLFISFALINHYKLIYRGDPLMPWDLMLQKEAGNIFQYLDISVDKEIALVVVSIILIIIATAFIKPFKLRWQHRALGITISVILATLVMKNTYLNSENIEKMGIQDVFWNQTRNYEINGFITGFGMNIKNAIIKPPATYSKNKVDDIIDEYMDAVPVFAAKGNELRPNIIMLMNEALWDPTLLDNVTYSKDPIPTINKIREEGTSGWLLVPGYGGGTSNTEFEILTGNSMSFLPTGSMAYQQYVKGPLDSMASFLKNKGYSTIAIHPYEKWFWDRDEVYPYLGFEEFISDEDFVDPHIRGEFISDMEASQEIIRQYEKRQNKPFFNYTVTMQNHGPYNDNRYGDDTIKVKGNNLSKESIEILQTYAEGVKDADDALKYLIDYFESVKEPTIIVMFGDHLPMLGHDYSVYKEAGFVSEKGTSLEDNKNLHLTPLLVWDNYQDKQEDIGIINASYLGAYVMEYANMEKPMYFNFLYKLYEELPPYIKEVIIQEDGKTLERLPKEEEIIRQKHWMLQYDLMFGKNHGKDALFTD